MTGALKRDLLGNSTHPRYRQPINTPSPRAILNRAILNPEEFQHYQHSHTSAAMAQDSFRFLDLPTELSLHIYGFLINRTHFTSRMIDTRPSNPEFITFTRPDPIPPLHLTCKAILAEIIPLFTSKLERMSVDFKAPRLVLHPARYTVRNPRNPYKWCSMSSVYIDLFTQLRGLKDKEKPDASVISSHLPPLMDKDMARHESDIIAYIDYTRLHLAKFNVPMKSFREAGDELWERAARNEGPPKYPHREDDEDVVIKELGDRMKKEPNNKNINFQILVDFGKEKRNMVEILIIMRTVAVICSYWKMRAFVYTTGVEDKVIHFKDDDHWVRYEGHLDKKTWREEWF
ncbi:hypothetical protein FB567DRAFT_548744 [Paraphoma chrysanthemicola]|uniref:Uncharacterized protein n=1 Tax=Paraphoma chrysanthemicola TaxID=798071 RepID=A0A8K0VYE4_9PLEO|nr:hypothetical protein FB567DRAFT_548744 [Paraphoma chrysanthemicola]